MRILVRDNNIDQALRILKKKMQREGIFREMKQRRSYEKPSERKTEKSPRRFAVRASSRARNATGSFPNTPKKKLLDTKKPGRALG